MMFLQLHTVQGSDTKGTVPQFVSCTGADSGLTALTLGLVRVPVSHWSILQPAAVGHRLYRNTYQLTAATTIGSPFYMSISVPVQKTEAWSWWKLDFSPQFQPVS